jgi:hypothetical protein
MTPGEAPRLRREHRRRAAAGLRAAWLEGAAVRRTLGYLAARQLLDWYRGRRSRNHELFAFSR